MATPVDADVDADADEASYIDYETFLDPSFSAPIFANTLVLATNNPNDVPLDLSTPLSRVLFDTQEMDSHIDSLTTKSAIPLIEYTKQQTEASKRIAAELDIQIKALTDSYKQLEKDVIQKHAEADEVRQVATRLWATLRMAKAVLRCLQLGQQLQMRHQELGKEDHRALVRCAQTILSLRELLDGDATSNMQAEGYGLHRVAAVQSLQSIVLGPVERSVCETAERVVREFSMGSATTGPATFAQSEETKARTVSALIALNLLSPSKLAKGEKWVPTLMVQALEAYLRTALQSSIAGLSRALAALPSLERSLGEVSARCQNVVALESILETTKPPLHPLVPTTAMKQYSMAPEKANLLQPLLAHLETGSLASYFWRSMASSLATRVQDMVSRGGAASRVLKTQRSSVSDAIKGCVIQGSQLPPSLVTTLKGNSKAGRAKSEGWEREVAVMVGAVTGNLGR